VALLYLCKGHYSGAVEEDLMGKQLLYIYMSNHNMSNQHRDLLLGLEGMRVFYRIGTSHYI